MCDTTEKNDSHFFVDIRRTFYVYILTMLRLCSLYFKDAHTEVRYSSKPVNNMKEEWANGNRMRDVGKTSVSLYTSNKQIRGCCKIGRDAFKVARARRGVSEILDE